MSSKTFWRNVNRSERHDGSHPVVANMVLLQTEGRESATLTGRVRAPASSVPHPNRSWRVDESIRPGWWTLSVFVSSSGLVRRNHQVCAVAQTRSVGGQALPAAYGVARTTCAIQSYQCQRSPGIRHSRRRTEAIRRTRKMVPPPDSAVYEQYRGQDHRFIKKRIPRVAGFRSPSDEKHPPSRRDHL